MASTFVVELIRARTRNSTGLSSVLGQVPHKGLKGRLRELSLEELTAPYLPPQVELLTGAILRPNGERRIERKEDDSAGPFCFRGLPFRPVYCNRP